MKYNLLTEHVTMLIQRGAIEEAMAFVTNVASGIIVEHNQVLNKLRVKINNRDYTEAMITIELLSNLPELARDLLLVMADEIRKKDGLVTHSASAIQPS